MSSRGSRVEEFPPKFVGARVKRREDQRLLTGRGAYVDDHRPPGLLHAAFLRSPYAHTNYSTRYLSRPDA